MESYDPSENVLALVKAAGRRTDDLADAREQLAQERHRAVRREMKLRAGYSRWMDAAESRRLDALRGLDRSAVDRLAETTATLAVTLREGVESTARTLAAAQETSRKELVATQEASRRELDGRISTLERLQAAGTGKGAGLDKAWYLLGGIVTLLLGLYALGSKAFGH